MTKHHLHLALGAITTALLVHGGVALAQPETAKTALERAHAAQKAGRVHEACDAYAASDKLEPTIDTELALANCYELDGKLMSASRLYKTLSDKDTNAARAKTSLTKATALEGKAPRLRLTLSQRPDGLVIKVDGEIVQNTSDVRVDIGPHEVVATAPGFEGHANAAADRERAIVDVIVRMEPKAEPAPAPAPMPAPAPAPMPAPAPAPAPAPTATVTATAPAPLMMTDTTEPAPHGHRMRNGIILDALGAGLVIGAIVSYSAGSDKYSTEASLCPNSTCKSGTDLTRANALLYNADGFRAAGTAMVIGGGALLVVGSYLIYTGHHTEAAHVAVDVAPGHAGLAFTGAF